MGGYESTFNTKGHRFRLKKQTKYRTIKICIKCFCEVVLNMNLDPHDISTWQPNREPIYLPHQGMEATTHEPECDSSHLKELAYAYLIRKEKKRAKKRSS